ncbi:MAG TPA: LamG domain-containing protein [Sedimentisphaerales bacterium]|nr:LamG domain-containing protein [Sedimentisphaerales bacterium]
MCKKLIYLMSFGLVLGMVSSASADLVAHWKLDDEGTSTVIDSSGYGHDGTLVGDTHFVPGLFDEALELDGDGDYVVIDGYTGIVGDGTNTPAFSITAWIKTNSDGEIVGWGSTGSGNRMEFLINSNRLRLECGGGNTQGDTAVTDGLWHHVALTVRENSTYEDGVTFYLDGQEDTRANTDPDPVHPTENFDVKIGLRYNEDNRIYTGLIDEVRIYDNVLTVTEIRDIMELGYLARAHSPEPSDGSMYTDTWATLTWTASGTSVSHDVYFGTSFEDVSAGAEETFAGNMTVDTQPVGFAGFPAPDGLVPGSTYYWRVDEVNEAHPDSPWQGEVWSFWVPFKTGYNPDPMDGAQFEDPNVDLNWGEGMNAIMHTIYFGTDADEVANATGAPTQMDTGYDPGLLDSETMYYWRVDTFNGSEWVTGPVWSFRTMPVIPMTDDPNLVAWWKLDEGAGTTVVDWSGNNHHGKFTAGQVEWVEGKDGGALAFPDGWVEMTEYEGILGTQNRTVNAWINTTGYGDYISWGQNVNTQKWIGRVQDTPDNGTVGAFRTECSGGYIIGSTVLTDGQWHHVTSVLESFGQPDIMDIKLYVDGVQELISGSQLIDVNTVGDGRTVWLGEGHHGRLFPGLVDDVRLYNKALTQDEIKLLMRGNLLLAWDPDPPKGRTVDIESALPLRWKAGDNATQHDVYFGTDKDAVADANTSTADIYRGRQGATSYNPPQGVEWGGGPYYWRIDEYNNDATINEGQVWSFTVADFIVIDDFEGYDSGENQIWYAWRDGLGYGTPGTEPYSPGNGTGSAVGDDTTFSYTEETIVHGGVKSIPFFYDNSILRYSEAEKTLTSFQDWTKYGIKVLSIWFRGISDNSAEPMYIVLNGSAVVTHDNPNAVQLDQWTEWTIDLQRLADQGVNLANVNTIGIGFGNRNNPVAGGSGTMYFDDIRLYQPAPGPEPAP